MSSRASLRGYIASREVRGTSFPQRLQNLLVREHAVRLGYTFKLSATEYAMPGCYMMLENVMQELPQLQGIVAFSMFMLPQRKTRRLSVYERILQSGAEFHAALENVVLKVSADIDQIEDLFECSLLVAHTPFSGRYEKANGSYAESNFWKTATARSV